ncbi:MAG: site-2 protease family protein [Sphingobacteriia bacterium]|nr:site-2 protease family protein [Sphingobacteriia bacterium]
MESLFNGIHNVISFLLIITLIVFIHELGHYLIAKFYNVRVRVFSIGMGKELIGKFDKSGTRWRLSLLPIGGYVSLFGHNEFLSQSKYSPTKLTEVEKSYAFDFKPIYQRCLIVFAGPLFNFILSFIIICSIFLAYGYTYVPAKIGKVVKNMPAYEAGLESGDLITHYNGKTITSFFDLQQNMLLNTGEEVKLTVKRHGEEIKLKLTPKIEEVEDFAGYKVQTPRIGITDAGAEVKQLKVREAVVITVDEIYKMSVASLTGLKQMIFGQRDLKDLGGIIRIADYSGKSTQQGFKRTMWFIAALSLNLGLFNLLPIPALDGGYIVVYLLESVIGKNNAERINAVAIKVGIAIIFCLMLLTTYNDIKSVILN